MTSLAPALRQRLTEPLQIGSVRVNSRVLQSPLSGVTDKVFRRLVRRYAPTSMMYTEMVHAAGVCHVDTLPQIMEIDPDEHPISIQLFDGRPDFLADAARRAVAEGADTIDLNMGCPVNKITRKGGRFLPAQRPGDGGKNYAHRGRSGRRAGFSENAHWLG